MQNSSGGYELVDRNGLMYIQFDSLLKYEGELTHCFTTRIGGVSAGECGTLNLGFKRRDSRENVVENFRRICGALDIDTDSLVFSDQVHGKRVEAVDESDRGKGITRENDNKGCDALITDRPGVALVTVYADCVPVFLYDSVKRAAGLVHSGWRGTLLEIAAETVGCMSKAYGAEPGGIIAVIGPSLGLCCFEVDEDVKEAFHRNLEWSGRYCHKGNGVKWNIDLAGIIRHSLVSKGVKDENISAAGICTKCRSDLFFSHRGDKGRTGSMAAIMQIKEK